MLHELPTIGLTLGGKTYKLFVASSHDQKLRGLSGVNSLTSEEGMIFTYDDEKPRTFQFRETLLPLKVYFIGSSGKVVQRSSASAGQKENISCNLPSRWVIEVLDEDTYYAG